MTFVRINGIIVDEHIIYDLGYDSAKCGLPETSNPYPENSYSNGVWSDGWFDWDANDKEDALETQIETDDSLKSRGIDYAEDIAIGK